MAVGFLKEGEKVEIWEAADGAAVEVSHVFETVEEAAASGVAGLKHRGHVVKKWGALIEKVVDAVEDVVEAVVHPKKHKKK